MREPVWRGETRPPQKRARLGPARDSSHIRIEQPTGVTPPFERKTRMPSLFTSSYTPPILMLL
jgi:hypothetical protein